MDMPKAIAALFAFVALYDTQALVRGTETISADYREALENHPVATVLCTAYVVAHLMNPRGFNRVDLFGKYAGLFGKAV